MGLCASSPSQSAGVSPDEESTPDAGTNKATPAPGDSGGASGATDAKSEIRPAEPPSDIPGAVPAAAPEANKARVTFSGPDDCDNKASTAMTGSNIMNNLEPALSSSGSLFFHEKFVQRQRSKRGAEMKDSSVHRLSSKVDVLPSQGTNSPRRDSYQYNAEQARRVLDREKLIEALRSSSITADITSDEPLLDAILAEMIHIQVAAGSALWLRGEKAHMIYIVMSGELQEVEKDNLENQIGKSLVVQIHDAQRMLKNSGDSASDGEPRVLKKYTAGSTVGLDSLFLKGYRQATMIVREPVSLWAINRVTYQATVIKRKRPDVPSELDFLHRVPIFRALKVEHLQTLADKMQTEHFAADEVIIRQGSTGYKLFIIEKGKAKARDEDTNTDLSVMDTGHYFGEGSLLTKKPVSATVIATEDVICRTLEGRLFDSQLGLIHDIMFKRFQVTLIHQIKLFRENFTREDIEEMADHMTTVTYRSGDVILGANTVSHDFFIIQEGEVQEKGTGEGGTEELVVLVGGDYFGHESFLLGQPVQSTYVAVHDVKCSILNFDVASQVLGPVEEILKEHLHARDQFWDAQGGRTASAKLPMSELGYLRVLGQGNFGRVFLMRHAATGTLVALKQMSKLEICRIGVGSYIAQERSIMFNLHSPFVARIIRTYQTLRYIYIAQEFCPCGEFNDIVDGRHLPPDECRFYLGNILLGLKAAHDQLVVYRDLKPENIMVNSDGYLKLIDFGMAKKLPTSGRTFTLCGTPEYCAPEVVTVVTQGFSEGYDTSIDYWALGVVACKLHTGRSLLYEQKPTLGDAVREIEKHKLFFPDNCSSFFSDVEMMGTAVDEEARAFVTELLHHSPSSRLGSLGIHSIMKHPYFDSIRWGALSRKSVKPPFMPSPKALAKPDGSRTPSDIQRMSKGEGDAAEEAVRRELDQLDLDWAVEF